MWVLAHGSAGLPVDPTRRMQRPCRPKRAGALRRRAGRPRSPLAEDRGGSQFQETLGPHPGPLPEGEGDRLMPRCRLRRRCRALTPQAALPRTSTPSSPPLRRSRRDCCSLSIASAAARISRGVNPHARPPGGKPARQARPPWLKSVSEAQLALGQLPQRVKRIDGLAGVPDDAPHRSRSKRQTIRLGAYSSCVGPPAAAAAGSSGSAMMHQAHRAASVAQRDFTFSRPCASVRQSAGKVTRITALARSARSSSRNSVSVSCQGVSQKSEQRIDHDHADGRVVFQKIASSTPTMSKGNRNGRSPCCWSSTLTVTNSWK